MGKLNTIIDDLTQEEINILISRANIHMIGNRKTGLSNLKLYNGSAIGEVIKKGTRYSIRVYDDDRNTLRNSAIVQAGIERVKEIAKDVKSKREYDIN